ncbi:uncharacterized protein L201_006187 [Kwoniella dendrophila CBS 6074]|uniref:Transcription activator GCR1-like domain-containing protein n=1 Tax=Kwoniella dendrophila CBS 6074 TaxID=1295534 RepID=A0AAX4K1I3_9TREE
MSDSNEISNLYTEEEVNALRRKIKQLEEQLERRNNSVVIAVLEEKVTLQQVEIRGLSDQLETTRRTLSALEVQHENLRISHNKVLKDKISLSALVNEKESENETLRTKTRDLSNEKLISISSNKQSENTLILGSTTSAIGSLGHSENSIAQSRQGLGWNSDRIAEAGSSSSPTNAMDLNPTIDDQQKRSTSTSASISTIDILPPTNARKRPLQEDSTEHRATKKKSTPSSSATAPATETVVSTASAEALSSDGSKIITRDVYFPSNEVFDGIKELGIEIKPCPSRNRVMQPLKLNQLVSQQDKDVWLQLDSEYSKRGASAETIQHLAFLFRKETYFLEHKRLFVNWFWHANKLLEVYNTPSPEFSLLEALTIHESKLV